MRNFLDLNSKIDVFMKNAILYTMMTENLLNDNLKDINDNHLLKSPER